MTGLRAVQRRSLLTGLGALAARPARAAGPLRLLALTDISAGPGAVTAMRMAVEEFGGGRIGRTVDVVAADPGGDAARATAMVERWIVEDDVAAVVVLADGPAAEAAQAVCRARRRVVLFCGPTAMALSGPGCFGGSFMWTGDDRAIAATLAGHLSQASLPSCRVVPGGAPARAAEIRASLAARGIAAGAGAVAVLCDAAAVAVPAGRPSIAARLAMTEIIARADAVAEWLVVSPYSWAADAPLAWVRRFLDRSGRLPEIGDIGAFEAARHVLAAVAATGGADFAALTRQMRFSPISSPFTRGAQIGTDGRVRRPMQLLRIIPPAARRAAWDVFAAVQTFAPDQAGPAQDCRAAS
ncbi:MAG: ABC transporter substrate-binding protein [Alphaproteobacteria bacterium]|nr:ABC transporter substrate-binding protein [Alphaproteobacteria bacterium]